MTSKAFAGRRIVLVVVLLAIGALVVADRFADHGTDGATSSSIAATYTDAAEVFAEEQSLLASGPRIMQARDLARAQWQQLEAGMVRAGTVDLAHVAVRDALSGILKRDALAHNLRPASDHQVNDPGAQVQLIAQQVSFDASSPESAYALLDRLANMPDLRTRLVDLRMTGPGIKQVDHIIRVRVTVQAFAHIPGGGNG